MRQELRDIPPAPRRVRWQPLLAHRWLLFAPGAVLVVIGSLVAWLMFLQSGGKMSMGPRLAAGPTTRVTGRITRVEPPRQHWDGTVRQEVRYSFARRIDTQTVQGAGGCFLAPGPHEIGAEVQIDVLDADPNVSCIAGGMLHLDAQWLRARFWMTVMAAPGALLLLGWATSVFQLRRVLVHGDASIGVVHRVQPVRFVLPEMLRVDYTFRDHRAVTRHNHHWVRRHGRLGARLLQQMDTRHYEEMPVLHDRTLPHWNRMLLPQDFLPPPRPIDLGNDLPSGTRT